MTDHVSDNFWGAVPDEGRGSLPFALIHGEALVSAAVLALEAAGISLYDDSLPWSWLQHTERGLVLHDPLCPLTPPEFLAQVAEEANDSGGIAVGVRAVTDTVKSLDEDGFVGGTLDRDAMVQICSPIVLPPAVVAELERAPHDAFEEIVAELRQRWPVRYVAAPPLARRVSDKESVRVLEALGDASPA